MTDDQYQNFSKKLDILIRLTAFSLIENKKQNEQFLLLSNAGFQPKEIAEIVGTTSNTVRVGLSSMRKKLKIKI